MKNLILLLLLIVAGTVTGHSQDKLPFEQQLLLMHNDLEWSTPVGAYRVQKKPFAVFQDYDFGINLRREKVQVRYLVIPYEPESDIELIPPHLRAGRMAMHLASNEEDSHIAAHEIDPSVLDTVYNADWGQTFFFPPKTIFSSAKNCQMIALYREGVALCFVFLLFEEAPAVLPEIAELMRFRPLGLKN